MRTIRLASVRNARDLGGIPVEDGKAITTGLIFRGSDLSECAQEDSHILFDELGISYVIDLRCGWEADAKPDRIPSYVEYLHIPFYDMEKVGIEYDRTAPGTRKIGHDIACDPIHFYGSLSNPLTVGQIRSALHFVLNAASDGRPVYFHCSGGKDRAGVLSALILQTLGASADDVIEDYLATNIEREKDYDRLFARFLKLANGDEALAHELVVSHRARPENMEAFYSSVINRYVSIDSFMTDQLGIDEEKRAHFRANCTKACG